MNLYFECNMGAAGDMLASALLDLFDDREAVAAELNSLGLPDTRIIPEVRQQQGISGLHLNMVINGETEAPEEHHGHHEHHAPHRRLSDIYKIIDSLNVSDKVKEDVRAIYTSVAEAEAKVHGAEPGEVHFHELGMLDAVADITVCSYLMEKLNPDSVVCSPINVGNGEVKCAHGILPVPAPATAEILTGMPWYKSDILTELCTPTGAAILRHFADSYTDVPEFASVGRTGIGVGTKELERANIVRVFSSEEDRITELSCNVDDMTGEEIGFAVEEMMAHGALDCFVTPIFMKKGRPAYMLTVLCRSGECDKFARLIFRHTQTLGIRRYTPSRYTLERELTDSNGVTLKRSEGYGVQTEKIEFDRIGALARERDISVFEARKILTERYYGEKED